MHKAIPVCFFCLLELRTPLDHDRNEEKLVEEMNHWNKEKKWQDSLSPSSFPAVYRQLWTSLFIKYNTPSPSSAAVECLFSLSSRILTAKRASLTSRNFERLVFLKGNLDFLKWQGIMETFAHGSVDMATPIE